MGDRVSDEKDALELWRRWFEFSGDPYVMDTDAIDKWCFFCRNSEDEGHAGNCIYIDATNLLLGAEATCK